MVANELKSPVNLSKASTGGHAFSGSKKRTGAPWQCPCAPGNGHVPRTGTPEPPSGLGTEPPAGTAGAVALGAAARLQWMGPGTVLTECVCPLSRRPAGQHHRAAGEQRQARRQCPPYLESTGHGQLCTPQPPPLPAQPLPWAGCSEQSHAGFSSSDPPSWSRST